MEQPATQVQGRIAAPCRHFQPCPAIRALDRLCRADGGIHGIDAAGRQCQPNKLCVAVYRQGVCRERYAAGVPRSRCATIALRRAPCCPACLSGLAVFALWIWLDPLTAEHGLLHLPLGKRVAFDPNTLPTVQRVLFLTFRLFGLAVMVPPDGGTCSGARS